MPDPRIWPVPVSVISAAVVTVASAVALAGNPDRVDADFTNTSAVWIYLARGEDAVVGSGHPLAPRGGSYHIGLYNLFLGDIYAIADGDAETDYNLAISHGVLR